MEDSITQLKKRIQEMRDQIEDMGEGPESVEEFTLQGNAIRRCDHLESVNRAQSQVIDAYAEYADILEDAINMTLHIQQEITSIMKQYANG